MVVRCPDGTQSKSCFTVESIVHSLVEFSDGSVKAQLGLPDMRLPIECALAYPARMPQASPPPLDLAAIGSLTFANVDTQRFPCLSLATHAGRVGGTLPAVMAAADEVAVTAFLDGRMTFTAIPEVVEAVMARHDSLAVPSLEAVMDADAWARREAATLCLAGVSRMTMLPFLVSFEPLTILRSIFLFVLVLFP